MARKQTGGAAPVAPDAVPVAEGRPAPVAADRAPDPPADAERRVTIRDPAVMRALAHPARLAIMEHLSATAAATATECATVCGLSPSATSYHLRALARAGLVEEAPGRGDGRERLWRNVVHAYDIEGTWDPDPEIRTAARDLIDTIVIRDEARMRHWLQTSDREPREWHDAAIYARSTLVLTAEELASLNQAVTELFRPYTKRRRTDVPADARTVAALYRAFPTEPAASETPPGSDS